MRCPKDEKDIDVDVLQGHESKIIHHCGQVLGVVGEDPFAIKIEEWWSGKTPGKDFDPWVNDPPQTSPTRHLACEGCKQQLVLTFFSYCG